MTSPFQALLSTLLVLAACSPPPSSAPSQPRAASFIPSPTPSCGEPELWLGLHSTSDVEKAYCSACSCAPDDSPNNKMRWSFLSPRRNPLVYGCRDLEYASLAIRAYHGKKITREPYATVFETKPWYTPQANFSLAAISEAGRKNLDWFDTVTDVCKRQPDHRYAEPFTSRIESWFASRRIGDIELPGKLFVDSKPAGRKEFLEFLGHDPGTGSSVFNLTPRTPITYRPANDEFRDAFPGVFVWVIGVGTSASTLSCIDDQSGLGCEGYEFIQFIFDNETKDLIGLHVTASG